MAAAPAVATALVASACGSTTHATSPTTTVPPVASTVARGHGSVEVLYAGSLVNLMTKKITPAFASATGYSLRGFSAGSSALASQIKGKVRQGDVFISASPQVNTTLEGPTNGDWVSWYLTFASSPLVIGYNPSSRFAHDLMTKPWYQVIGMAGFLLGRTDPATDPKGALSVKALKSAPTQFGEPALATMASGTNGVFPEETLVGRLEAKQLDAGFFYSSEATAAGIPTVALTGESLKATYTITILKGAPDESGAAAFVAWLLGPSGRATLRAAGFDLVAPPKVSGTGVPAAVQSALSGQ